MWIKINNQVINSTLIRHISGIQEASPERFHADKMDEWVFLEMLEMGSAEVMKWRYMLNLVGLALGVETRTEPKNSFTDARWRVIRRTAVPGEAVKEELLTIGNRSTFSRSSYANQTAKPPCSSRSVRAVTLRTTKPQPHATRWLQC